MSDQTVQQVGERTVRKVPIDLIAAHPDNGRDLVPTDPYLLELGESIKRDGQLQAAMIAPTPPELAQRGVDRQFVLVFGHCRWFACGLINQPMLDCRIRDLSAGEIFRLQLIENIDRQDLSPIQEARKLAILVRAIDLGGMGLGQRAAAAFVGKSQSWVAKRLTILALPQDVQAEVAAGAVSKAAAYELAKLSAWPSRLRDILEDVRGKDELVVRDAVDHVLQGQAEEQEEGHAKVGRKRSVVETMRQAVIRRRHEFVPWDRRPAVATTAKIPGPLYARARQRWGRKINDEIAAHIIAWLEQELQESEQP